MLATDITFVMAPATDCDIGYHYRSAQMVQYMRLMGSLDSCLGDKKMANAVLSTWRHRRHPEA